MKPGIMKFTKLYALMCEGTIAIAFGIMAPMLIGAIGLAMDVSQAYLVRQRLNGAVDAAALAAAATYEDEGLIADRVVDFITANYAREEIGILDPDDIIVEVSENEVTVTASAVYPATFMSIFGFNRLTVTSGVVVARELKGLEVVLVLDNTGSLGASNMTALKNAAKSFVNILFERVEDPEDIKIGIVPYSSSVRVGRYGLGQHLDGSAGYGDPFVNLPSDMSFSNNKNSGWYGCVVEPYPNQYYNAGARHVSGSQGQLWTTAPSPNQNKCMAANTCRGHGWRPDVNNNNPYPYDVTDEYAGNWDIYQYGYVMAAGSNVRCSSGYTCTNCYPNTTAYSSSQRNTCREAYCWCSYSEPNVYCPAATVRPLTSNQDDLIATINSMVHEGATVSNVGMAWGARVLSNDPPFTEGAEWGHEDWNKAIVLMTDGQVSIDNAMATAYGSEPHYRNSITNAVLEQRLLEVCNWLKAEPNNVRIYTVTFDHATAKISAATKNIYRNCASEPKADYYFDAPTQAQLKTAFERISGALSNLHLKK